MRAIQFSETGGPDVLGLVDVADPDPAPGELVVRIAAAGVNFIDTYHRSGLYPVPLPYICGLEGAGDVVAVGEGVEQLIGDRVAWATVPGSYAELVKVPARAAVPVPVAVDIDSAAAALLQGMTAHYLTTDTFPLAEGHRCLVHAGAGGVGLLLIQIAKHLGAEVFTTVGSEWKAELTRDAGADHTIIYRDVDFAEAVRTIAGDRPIDVVYDGVGASTFEQSLGLLRRRGTMVTYGNASGPVPPISPLVLSANGSLFLTRPTLADYTAAPGELQRRAADIFGWITDGVLSLRIGLTLPLDQAAEAHRQLEARTTSGKVLLRVG
ncbi:MAG TPA: quinone oxidoreductase [Acidimicrobiales bacterium]